MRINSHSPKLGESTCRKKVMECHAKSQSAITDAGCLRIRRAMVWQGTPMAGHDHGPVGTRVANGVPVMAYHRRLQQDVRNKMKRWNSVLFHSPTSDASQKRDVYHGAQFKLRPKKHQPNSGSPQSLFKPKRWVGFILKNLPITCRISGPRHKKVEIGRYFARNTEIFYFSDKATIYAQIVVVDACYLGYIFLVLV